MKFALTQISHIFFDLDHTLWDHDSNARETIVEIFAGNRIAEKYGIETGDFFECYCKVNGNLWDLFRRDEIDLQEMRERRFAEIFLEFGLTDRNLSEKFSNEFLEICPKKPALMPGTLEILEQLLKSFALHVITNGFDQIQDTKMNCSGIRKFFETVTTSESSGWKKPQPGIFHHALKISGAVAGNCVYIGDTYDVDIVGADRAGMKTIFFNPCKKPNPGGSPEIQALGEIPELLGRMATKGER